MAWIGILILAGVLLLGILSRAERVPEECAASAVTAPFYRMAVYSVRRIGANGRVRERVFGKNEEKLRLLEPAADAAERGALHVIKKLGLCYLFLTVGTCLALLIGYQGSHEGLLAPDGTLQRHPYGKGRYRVNLTAQLGEESYEDVVIEVTPRQYTEEEIEAMLPEFHRALESAFLGKNETAEHITEDVEPVAEVPGYPFTIQWEYSDRSVLSAEGHIRGELPAEGTVVVAEAEISYGDYTERYSFPVMLYPRELSVRESLYERLWQALSESDRSSATEEAYPLPETVDGIAIRWTEKKTDHTLLLLALIAVMVGVIWWGKDKDLDQRVAERDAQLLADYPEVVSKLSLYVGAGMTVRMAWKKIAEESRAKRYIYEEMRLAVYEMESGTGELSAYQHFAKRARVQRYVKLVSLIEQSVKLGARGFLDALRRESEDALEEKKNAAKRKGEEAGTKLLVPMMLMLAIVMVVIIVPAFLGI